MCNLDKMEPNSETRCKVCGETFNKEGKCPFVHYKRLKDSYMCTICGYSSSSNFRMEDHQKTHTGAKPYRCDVCKRKFATKRSLTCHINSTHKDFVRPYTKWCTCVPLAIQTTTCAVCGSHWDPKTGDCADNNGHFQMWISEAKGICAVPGCENKTIMTTGKLLEHVRTHTGARPFPCRHSWCYYATTTSRYRKSHESTCKEPELIIKPRKSHKRKRGWCYSEKPKGLKLKYSFPCIQCGDKNTCSTKGVRCSQCAPFTGSSFTEQACMKAIQHDLGIDDLIFGSVAHQFRVPYTRYRVDGYSPSRKTIYEYHSYHYHGSDKYSVDRYKTLERMDKLVALGYTVYAIWGPEFLKREKGTSIESYMILHTPPQTGKPRELPPLDQSAKTLIDKMKDYLENNCKNLSHSKAKSQLSNLVDYASWTWER